MMFGGESGVTRVKKPVDRKGRSMQPAPNKSAGDYETTHFANKRKKERKRNKLAKAARRKNRG